MTDFLSNLVARTIAQPALQPRTRGRFEPAAAEAAPLVWPEAQPQVARPTDSVAPRAAATPRVRTAMSEPARTEATVRDESEHEEPPRETVTPKNIEPPRPTPMRRATEPAPPAPRTQTREAATPPQPARAETHREVERETVVEVVTRTEPATPPMQRRAKTSRTTPPEPTTPHRHDEVPPRIDATEPPSPASAEPAQATTRTTRTRRDTFANAPRLPASRQLADPRPLTPDPTPTIHVSIGRIEVRATTQQAPPRRESTRAPMSIDEYVARRDANGGGQ
jgi:hypothetical protein